MSWELYLPLEPVTRCKTTGRFLKGHRPANKGKKWSEYLSKKQQKQCSKGWENLRKYGAHPKAKNAGRQAKRIRAFLKDGKYLVFESSVEAAEYFKVERANICRCCRCNQSGHIIQKGKKKGTTNTDHQYYGIRYYFDDDINWWNKVGTTI